MSSARPLDGEVLAFAGGLTSLSRREAADVARRLGALVQAAVTARTTIIVLPAGDGSAATPVGQHATNVRQFGTRAVAEPGAGAPDGPPPRNESPAGVQAPGQHAAALAPGARVMTEDEFCALAGRVSPAQLRQHYYPLRTIRSLYPEVRDDRLRYLERWGLLTAAVRTPFETWYGFGDVAVIRQAAAELRRGVPFRSVVRSLAAERDGQLSLDFHRDDTGTRPATVLDLPARDVRTKPASAASLTHRGDLTLAELRFLDGERLESTEVGDADAAMRAYREALVLDPELVAAMINLANLHYAGDELAEALALYVHASLVAPNCFEAHYNQGNVHHDCGRFEHAAACYAQALAINPSFAEAHFYRAVTLEKLGRSSQARAHWSQYLALAPDGEWVELAREFLE